MSGGDFVHVIEWALGAALAAGLVAAVVLRLLRRRTLVLQIVVVAVATIGSLVGGMLIAADRMYVSQADFRVFLWLALSAGAMSVGLAVVLGRSLVRGSRLLVAQAREVGAVDSAESVPWSALRSGHVANEFAVLAAELASSDDRLRESRAREARAEASRRELVAWISHDLRTPLAGLRAMTEALEDGVVAGPADVSRYHGLMLDQVDRLGGMVDDLFQLSTIHAGALRLALQKVDVAELLDDIVDQLAPVAAARDIRFVARQTEHLAIEVDPGEMARAIANLAMNSIRLSPTGSEIVLSAAAGEDDFVVLSVLDCAGGIRETDLGRVFEPGWRGTSARTPTSGAQRAGAAGRAAQQERGDGAAARTGTGAGAGAGAAAAGGSGAGLGLAIVQGIVGAHSGHVAVTNVGDGCRFDVFVPRAA